MSRTIMIAVGIVSVWAIGFVGIAGAQENLEIDPTARIAFTEPDAPLPGEPTPAAPLPGELLLQEPDPLVPYPEDIPIVESGEGCAECEGEGGSCGCCSICGNRCQHHCFAAKWTGSTCNMMQHHAYFPAMHGYYYFRPYHHAHIAEQQQSVAGWGGDPRNPYANEIFKKVYAEYKAERGQGIAPSEE